jgi:nucleoside-diphosphate-sugar epimerase
MKRILVTGATGFLGMHVVFELAGKGYAVKALYRNRQKIDQVKKIWGYYASDLARLEDCIEWIEGDILDYYLLSENLEGIQEVYHAAGLVTFDDRERVRLNQINVQGTANLVNACLEKGMPKLCHVSSIATLGESNGSGPIDEKMRWKPDPGASAYAISKLKGEMEVWRGIHEGLSAVIVNPSVIIGPGMWMGSARHLLESLSRGLRFYPQGTTGYVDVRDVARVMVGLMEMDCMNDRYIVSAENLAHRDVLDMISDAFGMPKPEWLVTPRLMKAAVMAEGIRSFLTRTPPRITRKAMMIASERLAYSNQKVSNTLGLAFIPVEASVRFLTSVYRKERTTENR